MTYIKNQLLFVYALLYINKSLISSLKSEKNHSFLYSMVTSSKAWVQQLKKLDLETIRALSYFSPIKAF